MEYEPQAATRYTSILVGLLSPDAWNQKQGDDFMDAFREWETAVGEYERAAGEELSTNVRIAVVLRHAPADIKNALRMSMGAVKGDYEQLKHTIEEYCISGRDFDRRGVLADGSSGPGGVMPMDVGAVWQKGGNITHHLDRQGQREER